MRYTLSNIRFRRKLALLSALLLGLSALVLAVLNATTASGQQQDENERQSQPRRAQQTGKEVRVAEVQNQDVATQLELTGRVHPAEAVALKAEVQGVMQAGRHPFKEGTHFRKGETLLRIEREERRRQLQAQKSKFLSALVAAMADIKMDYPQAHGRWQDYLRRVELDEALPPLPPIEQEQLRYFLASRGIFELYYSIESTQARLAKYRLRAPFDGSLQQARVDAGGLVTPGQPLGRYVSTHRYELEAAVGLSELDKIQVGQAVQLTNRPTGRRFTAHIARINPSVDVGTQNVPVYLRLRGEGLKPGMYLEGQLTGDTLRKVVRVPRELLHRSGRLYVLREGSVHLVEVESVRRSGADVYVQGLRDGDLLLTDPQSSPLAGRKATARRVGRVNADGFIPQDSNEKPALSAAK
jgi:biotin carboxyl carrier protein